MMKIVEIPHIVSIAAVTFVAFIATNAVPANGAVILDATGISVKGVEVDFQAILTITGSTLTVTLNNNSIGTLNPDELLGSFYFDIVSETGRPILENFTAVGNVFEAIAPGLDSDLDQNPESIAVYKGGWEFKSMTVDSEPLMGFGIGTVGNNSLDPNGFNGNLVGNMDYGITAGNEIETRNLNKILLVKQTATFKWDIKGGTFTEDDIVRDGVFGLGTAPDSTISVVPEPATLAIWSLLGAGTAAVAAGRRRRSGWTQQQRQAISGIFERGKH